MVVSSVPLSGLNKVSTWEIYKTVLSNTGWVFPYRIENRYRIENYTVQVSFRTVGLRLNIKWTTKTRHDVP